MEDINEIKEKYAKSVIDNLKKKNFYKIINFLQKENCDYIDDIVSDYLDLFTFEYEEFIEKYNKLNEKYNYEFLREACKDMNLFEEFYNI